MILIDIDMPKNCGQCPIKTNCIRFFPGNNGLDGRPDTCPLHELPKEDPKNYWKEK